LRDKVDYRELGADYVDEKKCQSRIKYYQQAFAELRVDVAEIPMF
jgi:hypothetical protein